LITTSKKKKLIQHTKLYLPKNTEKYCYALTIAIQKFTRVIVVEKLSESQTIADSVYFMIEFEKSSVIENMTISYVSEAVCIAKSLIPIDDLTPSNLIKFIRKYTV
jgi:hypothetical protein